MEAILDGHSRHRPPAGALELRYALGHTDRNVLGVSGEPTGATPRLAGPYGLTVVGWAGRPTAGTPRACAPGDGAGHLGACAEDGHASTDDTEG